MGNEKHNKEVLESLNPGDMIKFQRGPYSHWGIYCGNGQVIHSTGRDRGKRDGAVVKKESFWEACEGKQAYKSNSKDLDYRPLPVEQILERAESLLNEIYDYNFITNNCEHFASWCRYGIEDSEQSFSFVLSTTHVATGAAGGAIGGGIIAGPLGAVVGDVAGAVGATAAGVGRGVVFHFRSQ